MGRAKAANTSPHTIARRFANQPLSSPEDGEVSQRGDCCGWIWCAGEVANGVIDGVGRMSVWDYAGQPEYYPTHELFLLDGLALFLVVCSLALDAQTRLQHAMYWLCFVRTRFQHRSVLPKVVLCGTNRDRAVSEVSDASRDTSCCCWWWR